MSTATRGRFSLVSWRNSNSSSTLLIPTASEGWDQRDAETVKDAEQTAKGSIVLALNNEQIRDFDTYYKSLDGNPNNPLFARNAWLEELWQEKYHCSFNVDARSKRSCIGKRVDDTFVQDDKVLSLKTLSNITRTL